MRGSSYDFSGLADHFSACDRIRPAAERAVVGARTCFCRAAKRAVRPFACPVNVKKLIYDAFESNSNTGLIEKR
jgi:hypothetical protein